MQVKNLLLILCAMFVAGIANAQVKSAKSIAKNPKNTVRAVKPARVTGFENVILPEVSVPPATVTLRSAGVEEQGGRTGYDLQTNGCMPARVHEWPDGNVSMAWTVSPITEPDGSGWPTRGTAVNTREVWLPGGAGSEVDDRIEAVRTGFSSYVVTGDGTEMTFAHTGAPYRIRSARRASGASIWTEANLPTQTPKGVLWCKAAADGNYVHVIALTTPTGSFGGDLYRGCNGHVLYYRSPDNGLTWDVVDGVIPGVDSSKYSGISGDSYTITAKNGIVAVGIFDGWGDTKIAKSENNGSSWITFDALDFPMDKYVFDTPYDVSMSGGPYEGAPAPNGVTDSLAMETNDEKGTVVIDAAGYVHAFFGYMWVTDPTPGNGSSNFYPGTNGIVHFNEADPEGTAIITGALDLNGDTTLTLPGELAPYGSACLSSFPIAAADDEGNIYLAYAAVMEGDEYVEANTSTHFRHIYVMKSTDFGATWNDPYDIVNDGDPALSQFVEAVFPSVDQYNCSTKLHLQYQRDFVPGPAVQKEETQADEISDMIYWGSTSIVGVKNAPANTLSFSLTPNPTSGTTTLNFQNANAGETVVDVLSLAGNVMYTINKGELSSGFQSVTLNTAQLSNGVYFVRVRSGNSYGTQRLVVLK